MAPDLKQDTPEAIIQIASSVRDTLQELLRRQASDATATAVATAIDTGRGEIQRLRLETIGQRIRSAGEALGLDQEARRAARDAWTDRKRVGWAPT